MKKLTLVFFLLGFLQAAKAQFEGVLYYDCTIKNKTLTTIFESKTKVLLESKIFPMKGGVADIGAGKEQDDLLFDFDVNKATRISARHKEAFTSDMVPVTVDRMSNLKEEDIGIEDRGDEKIGDYNCHHFNVKIRNKTYELWITKDLGASSICMISQFDYFPAGSLLFNKLKAAGGDGVVVRSKTGDLVVNLTNVQKKTVPSSYFEIPAGYKKL
jgi:Domain of unknown function (DUF4412)